MVITDIRLFLNSFNFIVSRPLHFLIIPTGTTKTKKTACSTNQELIRFRISAIPYQMTAKGKRIRGTNIVISRAQKAVIAK